MFSISLIYHFLLIELTLLSLSSLSLPALFPLKVLRPHSFEKIHYLTATDIDNVLQNSLLLQHQKPLKTWVIVSDTLPSKDEK